MKKLFFVLAALALPACAALAADKPAVAVAIDSTVAGKVKSVSLADAAKGTKSEIVVTDDAGKDTSVLVTATTTLYDADTKGITLDKIAVDSKVDVTYAISPEGVNQAKSVKIVK